MIQFLALTAIFWIPPFIVILKNILWDLRYWEVRHFHFGRFLHSLLWDHEVSNRRVSVTAIKFILFSLISLFLFSPHLTIVGIAGAFTLWIFESLYLLESAFGRYSIKVNLLRPRNYIIFLMATILITSIVALISKPFAILDRSSEYYAQYTMSISEMANPNIISFPDIYIFLAISALTGLFLDLSSSIITTLLVYLTSPFSYLFNQLVKLLLRAKLSQRRNRQKIILIIGSEGTLITKQVLQKALKKHKKTYAISDSAHSKNSIYRDLLKQPQKDIVLVNFEPGKGGEVREMCKILSPDTVILNDLTIHNSGLFKNKSAAISAIKEAAENTEVKFIINHDNKYLSKIFKNSSNKKIFFTKSSIYESPNEENTLKAYDLKINKNLEMKFKVSHLKSHAVVHINSAQKALLHPLLASLATSINLEIPPEKIIKTLSEIDFTKINFEIEESEDGGKVMNHSQHAASIKSIIYAINHGIGFKHPEGEIILATAGVKGLGVQKTKAYIKLLQYLAGRINLIITSDTRLHNLAIKAGIKSELADEVKDYIYLIRKNLNKNDLLLIEGPLKQEVFPV